MNGSTSSIGGGLGSTRIQVLSSESGNEGLPLKSKMTNGYNREEDDLDRMLNDLANSNKRVASH